MKSACFEAARMRAKLGDFLRKLWTAEGILVEDEVLI